MKNRDEWYEIFSGAIFPGRRFFSEKFFERKQNKKKRQFFKEEKFFSSNFSKQTDRKKKLGSFSTQRIFSELFFEIHMTKNKKIWQFLSNFLQETKQKGFVNVWTEKSNFSREKIFLKKFLERKPNKMLVDFSRRCFIILKIDTNVDLCNFMHFGIYFNDSKLINWFKSSSNHKFQSFFYSHSELFDFWGITWKFFLVSDHDFDTKIEDRSFDTT